MRLRFFIVKTVVDNNRFFAYDDIEGGGSMKTQTNGRSCFAAIGSITYAQKAQKALANAAIPSSVTKAEVSSSKRGCVYGVRFSCLQEANVRTVLSNARIAVKEWVDER